LFAAAGPTIWNNLPEYLRDSELSTDTTLFTGSKAQTETVNNEK